MSDANTLPPVAADAELHHQLMKDNALRIFSEPDAAKRMSALQEIWAPDGVLIEQESIASGYDEISAGVGALLAQLPPGTLFAPEGEVAGHHGVGRLRWRATSADGTPGPVTGTDIAFVEDGRITRLYVILDPMDGK